MRNRRKCSRAANKHENVNQSYVPAAQKRVFCGKSSTTVVLPRRLWFKSLSRVAVVALGISVHVVWSCPGLGQGLGAVGGSCRQGSAESRRGGGRAAARSLAEGSKSAPLAPSALNQLN